MRLFIALDLPEAAHAHLSDLQKRLQTGARFLDAHPVWVPPENFHLTLVFVGSIAETRVPEITAGMDEIAAGGSAFPLKVGAVELFPDTKQPKVVSCGLGGPGVSPLRRFQEALRHNLSSAGFDLEARPWRPHITLARIKSIKAGSRLGQLVESHAKFGGLQFSGSSITLSRSVPGSSSMIYQPLHTVELTH